MRPETRNEVLRRLKQPLQIAVAAVMLWVVPNWVVPGIGDTGVGRLTSWVGGFLFLVAAAVSAGVELAKPFPAAPPPGPVADFNPAPPPEVDDGTPGSPGP